VADSADPVVLGVLADLLGVDRGFRLANTLRRRGFLANPNGRKDYVLVPSIWRFSREYDWNNMSITFSHEHLKRLAVTTRETTHLALREGSQVFFIDHCSSSGQLIAVSGQTGGFMPLYCTAHGAEADCELADLKLIFGAAPLRAYTPRTITSLKQMASECARIKANGFAGRSGVHGRGSLLGRSRPRSRRLDHRIHGDLRAGGPLPARTRRHRLQAGARGRGVAQRGIYRRIGCPQAARSGQAAPALTGNTSAGRGQVQPRFFAVFAVAVFA
jgi:DNA-binding IclR family transcriptional regulator